jgi:3-oxoadipate enol-lactonase / 4-carboxymuconolactone decarboxylase
MAIRLAWRTDGPSDARPLVLLNSVGATSAMWEPCLAPLAEQFRVIRIDTRGHGNSPAAPPGEPSAIADLAADVLLALDELGVGRADLAGLSLGGMVGMWLAVHRPERIGRLALLCTAARLPQPELYAERAQTVRRDGMAAIAGPAATRWITPDLAARDPAVLERLVAMIASVDAESYAQCCEAIAAMDQRADLSRIASQTLVIGGASDVATPTECQQAIAEAIPGARLESVPGAAHLATAEQPGRVARLLLDHFRGGATAAGGYGARRAVLGDDYVDAALRSSSELTADFQDFLTRYAWGDVWTRPGLARRERSIATLAALVTLGAEHELASHVRGALRNGLTAAEIIEVLHHVAVYAGLPRANRAVAIARDVLAEEEPR